MLLLRAPIEKVELEPHKPERAEKRGREGAREKGKGNLDLLFLGHALGKPKRERMRETQVANYEWPMNISPSESTKRSKSE